MADSGLDTGSATSAQETTSEHSSTDLDEPNDYTKTSNINIKHHTDDDGLTSQDKSYASNNLFYESDRPAALFQSSENLPTLLTNDENDTKSNHELSSPENTIQERKKIKPSIERQEDLNSSANNSYFFIDASSLNDDLDVTTASTPILTTSITPATSTSIAITLTTSTTSTVASTREHTHNYNSRLTKSNQDLSDSSCNILVRAKNILVDANNSLYEKTKTMVKNYQNPNKLKEELQQNQAFSGFSEDYAEKPEKVKNLLTIQQGQNSNKNMNKESLVVEIKEADSGESAQHSPCPDNTKVDELQQKVEEKLSFIDLPSPDQQLNTHQKDEVKEAKPLLIRRNTFELDTDDERLSSLRQEYERRQGSLVFQNSITQYSSHCIDGESYFDIVNSQSDSMIAANSLPLEVNYSQTHLATTTTNSDKKLNNFDGNSINSILMLSSTVNSLDRVSEKTTNVNEKDEKCNGSLVHPISRSASDKLLLLSNNCLTNDDICFNSLPVNINDYDVKIVETSTTNSKIRRNEATPIVSGGSSCEDYRKVTDSPSVKRRTESTPIVSGGSRIVTEDLQVKDKVNDKGKANAMAHSMNAWVVDMSDCRNSNGVNGFSLEKPSAWPKKGKDSQFTTSLSNSLSSRAWSSERSNRDRSQPSSLGYFVNLDDLNNPNDRLKEENSVYKHRRRPSDTVSEKSYCEFFVDLSDKQQNQPSTVKETVASNKVHSNPATVQSAGSSESSSSDAKKNIFSMFIDLNEPGPNSTRTNSLGSKSVNAIKIAEKSRNKIKQDQISGLKIDLEEKLPECQKNEDKKHKPSIFMFIESDSPVVRRRTLSSSRPAFKRHSWNTEKSIESSVNDLQINHQQSNSQGHSKVHKRAHSLSVDRLGNDNCLGPLLNAASKLERDPLQQQQQESCKHEQQEQENGQQQQQLQLQTEIENEYEMRDTPPNSHVEILNHEELLVSLKSQNYQELDSIHEQKGIDAKNKLAQSNNQQDDCYSESTETRKSETFDISSSASGPSSASEHTNCDSKTTEQKLMVSKKIIKSHQDSRLHVRNGNKTVMNKGLNSKSITSTNFVRLSDLDKRPLSKGLNINLTNSVDSENLHRLSNNSTGTSSWSESKSITLTKTNEPLYRMLTKKLSGNLGGVSAKSENYDEFGAEAEAEAVISESDLSSLQSSMGRSGQGSTEETETSTSFAIGSKPYNRLGEDLLRMFLEEINPDVTIDVGGRRIRAHKCILSSRCQYFAAILSGSWVENSGNIISLQGYSYNAVHFALRHIYSGESCIPDTISIVELATLADMLCLEGLKEVIGFTLKVKYCHLFHKPCNGCTVGVLECMPLAAAYGLDEVYRKSLRWITRHFVRIWPTKEFATLPRELMDKCYLQHIVHMSVDNVLQTIMDCDKLLTTLPNVRWAEPVFRLVSNLVDTAMKYLTDNFSGVLGSESFQALDREQIWNISRLEDHLLAAAERLPPEQACKAYSKLDKIFICLQADDDASRVKLQWSPLFMDLMNKIKIQVEKCLIRDAARASRTNSWLKMDLVLRRRIQELACLVILPNEATNKRPSRHSNFLKEPKERQEPRVSSSRTPPNRSFDLRKVKMAISEHSDGNLKQTPLLQTRKLMNKPKTDPLQRKLHNDKLANDVSNVSRPKSWPNKIEVKSRYLEPRTRPPAKENIPQANPDKTLSQQKRKIMISSSDSSRTSSPAMRRADKKITPKVTKVPIKKDGKALSSDSLTGSNSRLNSRKEIASKSCGITRPESPSLKLKSAEAGMSVDSLSDAKRRQQQQQQNLLKKPTNRMDTSISTDSLMTDITTITTPKSVSTNKSSPILGKATNASVNQTRSYDKMKKLSPPSQQRNYNNHANHINGNNTNNGINNSNSNNNNNNYSSNGSSVRRPTRSLESSTAASRSRAAAVANTYHGSLNLRKSLLDAAKAPDIPNKTIGSPAMTRTSLRQSILSTRSSGYTANAAFNKATDRCERKEEVASINNQRSSSSPGSKRSPKSNISGRLNKSFVVANKQKSNKAEDKTAANKLKSNSQTTSGIDQNGPKFLNQSSRSGTFLKDEPTILNKSDIETAAIDI